MHFLCNRNNETNIDLYGLISNKYLFSDYINKLINNIILKYKRYSFTRKKFTKNYVQVYTYIYKY